jgi:N-acetylneuraminic acid mutarotase
MNKKLKLYFKFFLILTFLVISPPRTFASDIFSSWQFKNNLPYAIGSSGVYTYNAKIFVVDGATDSTLPGNLYTIVDSTTGNITSWQPSLIAPPAIFWHSVIKKDNYVYLIGGATYPPTSSIDSTYVGSISNDGSVASWNTTSSLPKPLSLGATAMIGNRIYYAGGFTQDTGLENDKVYVATINSMDGSLSSWTEAGILPTTLSGLSMVSYNNNLYIIGGWDGTNDSKAVYKGTPINGTISSWTTEPALPDTSYRSSYAIKDNYIFILGSGGHSGVTSSNQVYYTHIDPNGDLFSWTTSTHPLQKTICCGSAAVVGNYIYQIGGYNPIDGYLSEVLASNVTADILLDVPSLKQTDPTWKNQIYDTASLWSSSNTTINSWGCSVTSAAMVFQYNNITHLPDNTVLNPGSLNSWLKTQPDGYIYQGWINWLALARLSRLAKQSGNNPNFTFDALEYSRLPGSDKTVLINNLKNKLPSILEEPGHFIVAKGTNGNTFTINDPYYNRNILTDGYNDTFLSQGVFIPSHTDLSYFMITGNKNLNFTIHTSSTSASSFLQQQLASDISTNNKAGDPFSLLYFQKPANGAYTISVSSTTSEIYTLQVYTYDVNGNVKILPVSGVITPNAPESIKLMYDKNHTTTKVVKTITFESTIADIKEGNIQKLINPTLTPGLLTLIQTAQNLSKNRRTLAQAKQVLKTFETTLKQWQGTPALSVKISPILLEDEAALYSSF